MPIYQHNHDMPPDAEFEPGAYAHLVIGNHGRLLDPRRTPVCLVDLRPEVGMFVVRIEGFEDRGAQWEVPCEEVSHYQFAKGEPRMSRALQSEIERAVDKLDRVMQIAPPAATRRETEARLRVMCEDARRWLRAHSTFLANRKRLPDPQARCGDPLLYADLQAFLASQDLSDMESVFARQFVSNPYSGELVKGHRIVLAELGLVAYDDKIVRDPTLFDGAWSRARRAAHLLQRMAFVRALLQQLGHETVSLYRGISCEGPLEVLKNRSFVSTTFSLDVARSHFDAGPPGASRVLYQQSVSTTRLFMTYYETEQLNLQFREAEAVLLYDEHNHMF